MSLLGTVATAPLVGPIKGVLWLVRTLAEHAERELYDEDLSAGISSTWSSDTTSAKITIEEFESSESELLERLNEARRMKEGR